MRLLFTELSDVKKLDGASLVAFREKAKEIST